MYNMSYNTPARLGTSDFRKEVSDEGLKRLLAEHGGMVEVGRYHSLTAIVVAPEMLAELTESKEHLESLRSTLPLLLVAAKEGIPVPSETLARAGFDTSSDEWRVVNDFQARFPVRLTANEDGGPITRAHFVKQAPVREADDTLELLTED